MDPITLITLFWPDDPGTAPTWDDADTWNDADTWED